MVSGSFGRTSSAPWLGPELLPTRPTIGSFTPLGTYNTGRGGTSAQCRLLFSRYFKIKMRDVGGAAPPELDAEQRARMADIAERTPVTLALKTGNTINTKLADG